MESAGNLALAGLSAQALRRVHVDLANSDRSAAPRNAGADRAEFGRRAQHSYQAFRHHGLRPAPDRAESVPPVAEPTDARSTSASTLSYRRSESTSIFITTQEGDTVELKIRARESATLDTSEAATDDKRLTELNLKMQNSTEISFSVNGNLNSDELAAIQGVIEKTSAIAQDFFNGDVRSAFAKAEQFKIDATQLTNVGLRMSSREQLTYSQMGAPRQSIAPAPLAPPPSPTPSAGADTPAARPTQTIAPTPHTDDVPGDHPQAMVDALDVVRGFLNQLLEKLATPAASIPGRGTPSVDFALKLKILQATVTAIAEAKPSGGEHAPLPALVPNTLGALVAQHEPRLHAVT